MKKTTIFKLTLLTFLTLSVMSVALLFAIPKAILLDRFLSGHGVYIFPNRVEEGFLSVYLENLKVFYRNQPLGSFAKTRLSFEPVGLSLSAVCGSGKISALLGFRRLRAEFNSADCLKGIGLVSGNLELEGNKLKGTLSVRRFVAKGFKIDAMNLYFKGKSFDGDIEYMGIKLNGGGMLKLNLQNLLASELSGEFKGSLGSLLIRGRLNNITAELK
ncbi:hypothetical protein BCF55_1774 [Hydrogenivirga caldilitoris]|uniref:Type II secretion system protein N n=1 Tax=Hydrogenivirga caldilitoris TaxID=246264 RepID=A0A497XWE2_9AQUI|nr:hypothetical protein [Hydrogenivirga caldilitoris]RLJ71472.1 hypothetical protein BCF55_1774 [Hydrogenivirga caldilitoris]